MRVNTTVVEYRTTTITLEMNDKERHILKRVMGLNERVPVIIEREEIGISKRDVAKLMNEVYNAL